MKVRVITSLREFEALAPAWRGLLAESGQTSLLASHDWYACCWRTAGPGRRRELWMVEDAVGPRLLLPLVRFRTRFRGLPVRVVAFLAGPGTTMTQIPAAGDVPAALRVCLEVMGRRRDWDVLTLDGLSEEASILKALEAALPEPWPRRRVESGGTPYLLVRGRWEAFLRRQPPDLRAAVERLEQRFEGREHVEITEHRDLGPENPALRRAVTVLDGTMSLGPTPSRFLREWAHRTREVATLRLWTLTWRGRLVAAECQVADSGTLRALWGSADVTGELSGSGAYLHLRILRTLHGRGDVHEYDLGTPPECRLGWADGVLRATTVELYAPTVYGRLIHRISAPGGLASRPCAERAIAR